MAFPHATVSHGGALPQPMPLVVTLPPPAGVPPPYTLTIFEDPAGCGPGGALWDASVVLAQYVNTLGESLRGAAVIELGAGTGLPGLAAARLGADVTLTDRHERCAGAAGGPARTDMRCRKQATHAGLAATQRRGQ
jgi:hypothetical protein